MELYGKQPSPNNTGELRQLTAKYAIFNGDKINTFNLLLVEASSIFQARALVLWSTETNQYIVL